MLLLVKKVETVKQEEKVSFTMYDYGFVGLMLAIIGIVLFSGISIYHHYQELNVVQSQLPRLEQRLTYAKQQKPKVIVEKKKQQLMNARKAGQALAEAESIFVMNFFNTEQKNEADFKQKYAKAKEVIDQYLVKQNKEFASNPWLRNPTWKLKMETIVNFATENAPIIFTMTNDQGQLMGLVTATYDGSSFHQVTVKYTQDGLKDSVDFGGK